MTTEKQIGQLLDLIAELQKALISQQSMINKLTDHSSSTAKVVTKNANQALKNDQALFDRLKNAEAVINGILQRERQEVIENIGKN